jgi:glycerol-3-phosphate acyltransferase PlsY
MIEVVLAGALGYVLGAVPTGVLVSRLFKGVDVRQGGSGHTGGLNVWRVAGIWAAVLTGAVDVLLGVGAVAGAAHLMDDPWAATAAGVMAVVGHNWSLFIRFGGGIGLSTLAGGLVYLSPLITLEASLALLLSWLVLVALLRVHRARSTIGAMVAVGPLLWALGASLPIILLGAVGGLVVIVKTLPDWNREYD